MTVNELVVASEEQTLNLSYGYRAQLFFDPIYKRWYYNLYNGETLEYAGIALDPNTAPLAGMSNYYLGCVDKISDKSFYEPFTELGIRLGLMEVDNESSSNVRN